MDAVYENKSTPFSVMRVDKLSPIPHLHKEIEIVYVAEGAATGYADRCCCRMLTGDIFISFPNQIHYYGEVTAGTYYVLIFSTDLLFGLKALLGSNIPENNCLHIRSDDPVRRYLQGIMQAGGEYRLTVLTGYANLLLSSLLPQMQLNPLPQTDHSTLRGVLEFCSLHFTEDISLETVADSLHLSRYYISHLFNSKLNLGFSDYINTLRVNAACELLRETDRRIADVSEETGFGTIRSFNRAFLRKMQMTPQQYRELTRRLDPVELLPPDDGVCC